MKSNRLIFNKYYYYIRYDYIVNKWNLFIDDII